MSPRHQQPRIESFPELANEMLASKPVKILFGNVQEEGDNMPAPGLPSQEEWSHDGKHFSFTTQFDQRNRPRSDIGRGLNKPTSSLLPRPRPERSPRKRIRPARRHGESQEEGPFPSGDGDEPGPNDESEEELMEPSQQGNGPASVVFNPAALGSLADTTSRSGSSSGSGSTVTPASYTRNEKGGNRTGDKPDALSFLESDSPAVTEESIQRTVAEAVAHWQEPELPTSPQSAASSSSASSTGPDSLKSDGGSEQDTEPSTSPEQSVNGDIVSTTFKQVASAPPEYASPFHNPRMAAHIKAAPMRRQHATQLRAEAKAHRYGTPEMPRGRANLPHLPPNALTPRISNPGQGHVKHLPRAEKLPLTGYELLASQLSSHPNGRHSRTRRRSSAHYPKQADTHQTPSPSRSSPDEGAVYEPTLKPIYRRFEALNHRLLLHLQDELSELEEHLHRLDTADTQNRRLQNCILPASRRTEYMAGGELQWHKTDILGKIGFKLGQYNHVLSSFTATQGLPAPSMSDVQTYRTYLATHNPITEIETRFLDPAEDLVSLASRPGRVPLSPISTTSIDSSADYYFPSESLDEVLTPIPPRTTHHHNHLIRPANAPLPSIYPLPVPPRPTPPAPEPSHSSSRPSTRARRAADPSALATATKQEQTTVWGNPTPVRLLQILAAAAVAVEIPVLASRVVHGVAACVAVALLAGLAAAVGHVTNLGKGTLGTRGWVICAGLYGVVMAFVLGWVV